MSVLIGLLTAIHVLVALVLIILVLMQKSRDQGVGAAFGGGITESVFGAGTTTALVRLTIYCAVAMLITTIVLAMLHSRRAPAAGSLMQRVIETAPAKLPTPAQPSTPAAVGTAPVAPVAPESKSAPTPAPPPPAGKTP